MRTKPKQAVGDDVRSPSGFQTRTPHVGPCKVGMSARFTLDGSQALEGQLAGLCEQVRKEVRSLVPERKLQGLVLGGGYGRGEGGVLKTPAGEAPYNDLEFYIFLRGARWPSQRRYGPRLHELGTRLSGSSGVHIEFKCDSLEHLRRSPVSMYSYDLLSVHRRLHGHENLFQGCNHHLAAATLPLGEATRLLLNRCTGLLLANELLQYGSLAEEESDFIGRNLAKAQLALGDAVLTAFGQYHWSCRERHRRLLSLAPALSEPPLATLGPELLEHHAAGMDFKLHPRKLCRARDEFELAHGKLSGLASQLWVWLESRRLNCPFASLEDYCASNLNKCPETPPWRNRLLNLRSFGLKAALGPMGSRYPRERLFTSLPLLLWPSEAAGETRAVKLLQTRLQTRAAAWPGLVAAYKAIWPAYA